MPTLRPLALAATLILAAPAALAAQTAPTGFESGPISGWTNAFGAPIERVTSVGSVLPAEGSHFALLRSHACSTGATACPDNVIMNGDGSWNYAGYSALSRPFSATGSVAVMPSITVAGPASLTFSFNFLYNPVALGSDDDFTARNRDWALIRLFHGTTLIGALDLTVRQDANIDILSGAFTASGHPATGDFSRQLGWQTVNAALATAGTYTLEFGVVDQGDKLDQSAIAIDNMQLSVNAVPEPGTWALLATGLVGIGAFARRRRNA